MGAGDKLFVCCIPRSTAIVLLFCALIFLQCLGARRKKLKNGDYYKMRSILRYPRKKQAARKDVNATSLSLLTQSVLFSQW